MGFGDATLSRFSQEANGNRAVTRKMLIANPKLVASYKQWWFGKRAQFLVAMRDYLRKNGVKDAVVLYTASASEPGVSFPGMVTDDVGSWKQLLSQSSDPKDQKMNPISLQDVVRQNLYLKVQTSPIANWGKWELDHASPEADPQDYKNLDGVMLGYSYNRVYTVASPEALDAFRTPSGLAMIHHNSLNENMMFDRGDKPKLGYFACDMERAGPFCMMSEAIAMANGDPDYLGYLLGRTYARGFPLYVRNFNTAFLSLPALPSTRLAHASSDASVVVRSIKTPHNGTYFAVINTAMTDKTGVKLTLAMKGKVTDAATGEAVAAPGGVANLSLYPFEMRALHAE
jgi:hypothetical protein